MRNTISRRSILKSGVIAGVLIPAGFRFNSALADVPALDPADPVAKALQYTTKSAKPDQTCANCIQYTQRSGATGSCNIFAGKTVASGGWCLSWENKPAG
jgi:hypothetical protein